MGRDTSGQDRNDKLGDESHVQSACHCAHRGRLQATQRLGDWTQPHCQRRDWLPQVMAPGVQVLYVVRHPGCCALDVRVRKVGCVQRERCTGEAQRGLQVLNLRHAHIHALRRVSAAEVVPGLHSDS